MREIKFRAWHYEHKVMIDWEKVQEHSMGFLFGYGTVNLLQYTGLKDKNGKEIYEGDIIKCPESYETQESTSTSYITTGHIEFITGSFVFSDGGNLYEEHYSYDGDFEVIGNIYENPELSKEE